jgi:type VI secretion system secreted protein Hcp
MGFSLIIAICAMGFIGLNSKNSTALELNPEDQYTKALLLKVEGIDGTSQFAFADREHDIISFTWGASTYLGGARTEQYRSTSSAELGELFIVRVVDKASPKFFEYLVKGTHIPEVQLTYYISNGPYFKYTLTQVMVASIFDGGSIDSELLPLESISFTYGRFKYTAWEYDNQGSSKGSVEFCWDVASNSGC